MAWRERWLAVILVRSFMARPVRRRCEHAGDEAREDLERRGARRCVEPFPGYRRKARRKRGHRWIGWVEKGQVQLHGGSPSAASTRWVGRGERRRDAAAGANCRDCRESEGRCRRLVKTARRRHDPR